MTEYERNDAGQIVVHRTPNGAVVALDSAYDIADTNTDADVAVMASYAGVLPARFIGEKRPRGAISLDCGIGPQGSSIAGLWYLEALNVPAVAVDVRSVILGDGVDVWSHGVVSFFNQPAHDCGVTPRMTVRTAAERLLTGTIPHRRAAEVTNRVQVLAHVSGRAVVCTDSIAFGLPEDRDTNVLVTAGHTGRSAVPYLRRIRPHGFICSDGGMGRENSGIAALKVLNADGVPGATVDAHLARMGDGISTWQDGIISAANVLAIDAGVEVGMPCQDAAAALVAWKPCRNRTSSQ